MDRNCDAVVVMKYVKSLLCSTYFKILLFWLLPFLILLRYPRVFVEEPVGSDTYMVSTLIYFLYAFIFLSIILYKCLHSSKRPFLRLLLLLFVSFSFCVWLYMWKLDYLIGIFSIIDEKQKIYVIHVIYLVYWLGLGVICLFILLFQSSVDILLWLNRLRSYLMTSRK